MYIPVVEECAVVGCTETFVHKLDPDRIKAETLSHGYVKIKWPTPWDVPDGWTCIEYKDKVRVYCRAHELNGKIWLKECQDNW